VEVPAAPREPDTVVEVEEREELEELETAEEASAAEGIEEAAFESDEDDEVEDAEIIAETPVEETQETAPVRAADEPTDEHTGSPPEVAARSDEERELRELYGEPGAPVAAHAEFQDRQTADEDRPMMPEINAREERKQRWEERRDRRRQRREERGRHR